MSSTDSGGPATTPKRGGRRVALPDLHGLAGGDVVHRDAVGQGVGRPSSVSGADGFPNCTR